MVWTLKTLKKLKKGLDIIVGTPGRLLDFGTGGELKLKEIGFLVIDEADRLFDMGFLPDIKKLLRMMPPRQARQTMLFSATLDSASRMIMAEHLERPVTIEVTPDLQLIIEPTLAPEKDSVWVFGVRVRITF